jgi:2-dehydro-3-deoxygluconokinase
MSESVVSYREIKPLDACRFDGVSMGEVMLRFDPYDVPMAHARSLRVWQGGGETNVACGLAHTFGLRTAVLTALVDDHIGRNIQHQLQAAGVDTSWIIWFNTDSDGSRYSTDKKGTLMNGVNFTYRGKGLIPSDTLYYRAHTAVRELRKGDYDFESLFGKLGVRVFNTGGIFTLISDTSWEVASEAIDCANQNGTLVAADLNYRSKVQPDKSVARAINQKIAPKLGFLVGNDHDMADALGYKTEVQDAGDFETWLPAYKRTVRRVAHDFPNLSLIGTQWRGRHNADMVSWGAVLYKPETDQFYLAPLREKIPIRDRTGGGDSFLSGVMAALLNGKDLQTAVEWGAAHGILVQELPGDITMIDQRLVQKEVDRAKSGQGISASR